MSGQLARSRGAPNGPPEQMLKDSGQRPGLGPSNGIPRESMAAKFESEKRRIIESCFAKRDADGSGTFTSTSNSDIRACLGNSTVAISLRIQLNEPSAPSSKRLRQAADPLTPPCTCSCRVVYHAYPHP